MSSSWQQQWGRVCGFPTTTSQARLAIYFVLRRAVQAGADDFFIKDKDLKLTAMVESVFQGTRHREMGRLRVGDLAYFRCFGLEGRELECISELTNGYPNLRVLAGRLGITHDYTRKVFDSIYNKLKIERLGQLIALIAICTMFNKPNRKKEVEYKTMNGSSIIN